MSRYSRSIRFTLTSTSSAGTFPRCLRQAVAAVTDTYPDKKFKGKISAISPKVDPQTRNVQIEAIIANPRLKLLPGMYATINIRAGKSKRYLTLPRTAVTFNPYGETVYIVEKKA